MTTGSREPESGAVWTPFCFFFVFFFNPSLSWNLGPHCFFFHPQYCTSVYITFILWQANRMSQSLIETREVRQQEFISNGMSGFLSEGCHISTWKQDEKKMRGTNFWQIKINSKIIIIIIKKNLFNVWTGLMSVALKTCCGASCLTPF